MDGRARLSAEQNLGAWCLYPRTLASFCSRPGRSSRERRRRGERAPAASGGRHAQCLSFPFPSLISTRQRVRAGASDPSAVGGGYGAAAGPLAGARACRRMSAPPSSSLASAPRGSRSRWGTQRAVARVSFSCDDGGGDPGESPIPSSFFSFPLS